MYCARARAVWNAVPAYWPGAFVLSRESLEHTAEYAKTLRWICQTCLLHSASADVIQIRQSWSFKQMCTEGIVIWFQKSRLKLQGCTLTKPSKFIRAQNCHDPFGKCREALTIHQNTTYDDIRIITFPWIPSNRAPVNLIVQSMIASARWVANLEEGTCIQRGMPPFGSRINFRSTLINIPLTRLHLSFKISRAYDDLVEFTNSMLKMKGSWKALSESDSPGSWIWHFPRFISPGCTQHFAQLVLISCLPRDHNWLWSLITGFTGPLSKGIWSRRCLSIRLELTSIQITYRLLRNTPVLQGVVTCTQRRSQTSTRHIVLMPL